jgi:hypothetical protein
MSFKETTNKETDRDLLVASTSGSSSSGLHALPAPNTTQEGLQIKVENPDYQTLQQQLSVVKSGKIQLEKLYSQALDVKVVMQQKASDPIYQGKHKEFSTSCEGLNDFLQEVRMFLYKTEGRWQLRLQALVEGGNLDSGPVLGTLRWDQVTHQAHQGHALRERLLLRRRS